MASARKTTIVAMLLLLGLEMGYSTALADTPREGGPAVVAPHRLLLLGAIRTYQLVISPSKGSHCPMHPHCSRFGYEAFQRYNPAKATAVTVDRLNRCGHDLDYYETVEVDGYVRFFDPHDPLTALASGGGPAQNAAPVVSFRPAPDEGEAGTAVSDTSLFRFAESLQFEGQFDRAITEYRRLMFYFPGSPLKAAAMTAVLDCYYDSAQYLDAAHWGLTLITDESCAHARDEVAFTIGKSYLKLDNFQLAREYFTQSSELTANHVLADKNTLLAGVAYAHEGRWPESRESFADIGPESRFTEHARRCMEIAVEGEHHKPKKPLTAGLLSIVPGMGYLYSGYTQTAISAFIVNGLLIWGTVESFRQDIESLGVLLGIVSFGWYAGNIYGAVLSAERRNLSDQRELRLKLDVGFSY